MKVRCPYCNEGFELEAYLKDTALIQAIQMLPDFGPHARLVWEYAELFRIGPPLNARKLYRLLSEVRDLFRSGGFDFGKRRYEISRDGLASALRTVCNARIQGGLQNHNYLKKCALRIAEEEAAKKSREEEAQRKKAEEAARTGGARDPWIRDVPQKVKELLGRIG